MLRLVAVDVTVDIEGGGGGINGETEGGARETGGAIVGGGELSLK